MFITVVIEYPENAPSPAFSAHMQLLGGTVTAVQFNDALAELENLTADYEELKQSAMI